MLTHPNQTVTGRWNVVETQRRIHGEWIHESDFAPGEWVMSFHLNGRMSEVFHRVGCGDKFQTGSWALYPASGIVMYDFDDTPGRLDASGLLVFDASCGGPWIYFFEDCHDTRPTRDEIIANHADLRIKLAAV